MLCNVTQYSVHVFIMFKRFFNYYYLIIILLLSSRFAATHKKPGWRCYWQWRRRWPPSDKFVSGRAIGGHRTGRRVSGVRDGPPTSADPASFPPQSELVVPRVYRWQTTPATSHTPDGKFQTWHRDKQQAINAPSRFFYPRPRPPTHLSI